MLVSLRIGDESFQPGELPDDTPMWTENTRPKLYGQWLAWQLTTEHSIDPAHGVEPVPITSTDFCFKGKVIIENREQALHEATKNRTGLIFWTDGSKLDQSNAGAAVCWKDKRLDRWKNRSFYLEKNKEILDAELWAISEALVVVTKEIPNAKIPITVFCGLQKALTTIQHAPAKRENRHLRGLIYDKARELYEKGHPLEIRWIPAHSDITGNDKAHLAAKSRAEKGGKQAESWSSVA